MGVAVDVVRVACNTSTGTQDITGDVGGLTPKAAIAIVSYATTDGTAAADRVISWGATDGTRESSIGHTDEDAQETMDSDQHDETNFIQIRTPGAQADDGLAAFSAWLTDGIRIDWTDAPAAAYLLTVYLFAGSDLSVYKGRSGLGNTADNTVDITAPGFTPDLVFTGIARTSAIGQSSLGVVHFDGASTITQRSLAVTTRNGQATSSVWAAIRTDAGICWGTTSAAGFDWWGEFSDFDANGFSVITRNAGANNEDLTYLALNFGGVVDSWVGTYTTPTSTGNDGETGPGFTPQFVYLLGSLAEAAATSYTDNRGGSFAVSAFTASAEYTTVVSSEDAVGTSNTQSLADDRAIVIPDDDGTLDIEATFVSMDANGWTVNYSNAPATAKLFPALAIEAEAGAATKTHVLDAVLQAEGTTKTHVLDAILQAEATTQTHVLDAVLQAEATTQTHVLDTVLQAEATTQTHVLDAVLQAEAATQTHGLDAVLQAEATTQTHVLDTVLQAEAVTQTHVLDAVLQAEAATQTHGLDTVLQAEATTRTHGLDTVLQAEATTRTHVLDAVLQAEGTTRTHVLDTFLQAAGVATQTHVLDAVLQAEAATQTHVLDAVLQAEAVTQTHVLDAVLQAEAVTQTHVLDAVLQAEATAQTHVLDAFLQAAGVATQTHVLDTVLQAEATAQTHVLDAVLQAEAVTQTHVLDAVLQSEGTTRTHVLDAVLQAEAAAQTHVLDAFLQAAGVATQTHVLDTVLQAEGTTQTHVLDTVLTAGAPLLVGELQADITTLIANLTGDIK
jgi:hypothetical protein